MTSKVWRYTGFSWDFRLSIKLCLNLQYEIITGFTTKTTLNLIVEILHLDRYVSFSYIFGKELQSSGNKATLSKIVLCSL